MPTDVWFRSMELVLCYYLLIARYHTRAYALIQYSFDLSLLDDKCLHFRKTLMVSFYWKQCAQLFGLKKVFPRSSFSSNPLSWQLAL